MLRSAEFQRRARRSSRTQVSFTQHESRCPIRATGRCSGRSASEVSICRIWGSACASHFPSRERLSLRSRFDTPFDVVDYSEHAIGSGADAKAVAYVESSGERGTLKWGIGVDSNITTASLLAVLAAFERQHQPGR